MKGFRCFGGPFWAEAQGKSAPPPLCPPYNQSQVIYFDFIWTTPFKTGLVVIVIHTYYNVWLTARNGWKVFLSRRTAVTKLNRLADATQDQLKDLQDLCAICFDSMSSAKITQCGHYFHSNCLRKWLYIQSSCPLCHQDVLISSNEEDWQLLQSLQRLAAVG